MTICSRVVGRLALERGLYEQMLALPDDDVGFGSRLDFMLRRLHASALATGVDLLTISRRLGHRTPPFTFFDV
jgi:hypothetical protein